MLSEDEIEHNVSCIKDTLTSILQRNSAAAAGAPSPVVLNNLDWFGPMSFLGFLREVGGAQGHRGTGALGSWRQVQTLPDAAQALAASMP